MPGRTRKNGMGDGSYRIPVPKQTPTPLTRTKNPDRVTALKKLPKDKRVK